MIAILIEIERAIADESSLIYDAGGLPENLIYLKGVISRAEPDPVLDGSRYHGRILGYPLKCQMQGYLTGALLWRARMLESANSRADQLERNIRMLAFTQRDAVPLTGEEIKALRGQVDVLRFEARAADRTFHNLYMAAAWCGFAVRESPASYLGSGTGEGARTHH